MKKWNIEMKVGIFFVLVFCLIAWISTQLGDFGFDTKYGMRLSAVFATASGVDTGVNVNLAGIKIGTITDKDLFEGKARVYFNVLTKAKIPVDSKISIRSHGFLGQKYLEIIPGVSKEYFKDGEDFFNVEDSGDLSILTADLQDVAEDVKAITGNLREIFGGEEGDEGIREIFTALATISTSLADTLEANQKKMDNIMSNFESFTTDMAYLSKKNREDLSRAMAAFPGIAENMRDISGHLAGILENKDEDLEKTLGNLVVVTENLGRSLEAVANIAQKIDEGEGTLGKLVNEDNTIESINEAVEGINDYLTRVRQLRVDVSYRGEYQIRQSALKSYFNLNIRPNFDKFYMVSLIDAPQARTREKLTETETTINPGAADEETSTKVQRERVTTSELLFSAQIGQRWHNLLFRGGLIESHGGGGVEVFLWNDHLNFAFEAFDFSSSNNPHLKAYMNAFFLDHFIFTAGIDDFINRFDDPRYFVGVGLYFTDRDIKYLAGSHPSSIN